MRDYRYPDSQGGFGGVGGDDDPKVRPVGRLPRAWGFESSARPPPLPPSPQATGPRTPHSFPFMGIGVVVGVGFLLSLLTDKMVYLVVILTICAGGLLFANYLNK